MARQAGSFAAQTLRCAQGDKTFGVTFVFVVILRPQAEGSGGDERPAAGAAGVAAGALQDRSFAALRMTGILDGAAGCGAPQDRSFAALRMTRVLGGPAGRIFRCADPSLRSG